MSGDVATVEEGPRLTLAQFLVELRRWHYLGPTTPVLLLRGCATTGPRA